MATYYHPDQEEELYTKIKQFLKDDREIKSSTIQERLRIGYEDAWHFINRLENDGLIEQDENVKKVIRKNIPETF